jgi:microcystin-dependent protein
MTPLFSSKVLPAAALRSRVNCVLAALLLTALPLLAQTTAFNYTGYLLDGGLPANGSNDLRFTLYATNSAGLPVTNTPVITLINQPVNGGVFVVELDFGDVFDGSGRWLEIAARPGGSANPFSLTYPRQKLTAAPYAAYANNGMPPGAITAFGGTNAPIGWILCDGRAVSRTAYARLFAAIGTSWGNGDGSTTFNVPDTRGLFLRGVDGSPVTGSANRDPDRASRQIGSIQSDALQGHYHNVRMRDTDVNGIAANIALGAFGSGGFAHVQTTEVGNSYLAKSLRTDGANGIPRVASETRPQNACVNYLIKF